MFLLIRGRVWRALPVFFTYCVCAFISDTTASSPENLFQGQLRYRLPVSSPLPLTLALQLAVLVEIAWSVSFARCASACRPKPFCWSRLSFSSRAPPSGLLPASPVYSSLRACGAWLCNCSKPFPFSASCSSSCSPPAATCSRLAGATANCRSPPALASTRSSASP